jgi:hypothetical protein
MSDHQPEADFDWNIDDNIRRAAEGDTSVPAAKPKTKLRPVKTAKPSEGRGSWDWHYCQRCKVRGSYLPPEALGLKLCSHCVAMLVPWPGTPEYAAIKLLPGLPKRRRRG